MEVFTVRRPDTDRDIKVRAISREVATLFVAAKFPLVIVCPRCHAKNSLVLWKQAEIRRKFLGLAEDSDFIMGEPTCDEVDDEWQLHCEECRTSIKHPEYESIVDDSIKAKRTAEDEIPASITTIATQREGWAIFNNDERGYEIERIDEAEKFESDQDALLFVMRLAEQGSAMHQDALDFIERHNKVWEVE